MGAAATLYLSRKRPGAVAWASAAMSSFCSSMVKKAVNGVLAKKGAKELTVMTATSGAAAKPSAETWSQVESIVESDPAVKREVEDMVSGFSH